MKIARRHFERDWSGQDPASIRRFLPDRKDQRYLATLEELVHIDLELAWQDWAKQRHSARPATLEAYLDYLLGTVRGDDAGPLSATGISRTTSGRRRCFGRRLYVPIPEPLSQ